MAPDGHYLVTQILLSLTLLHQLSAGPVFQIEIITPGNINIYSLGSIPLIGPAIDLAVGEIQQRYGEVSNLTQKYLYDPSAVTCEEVDTVSDNLLAQYFYQRKAKTNMTAIIMPAWNLPIMFGAVSTTTLFQNRTLFPNVIAAGYANAAPYVKLCANLLVTFKWRHVFILYDASGMALFAYGAVTLSSALRTLKGAQIYLHPMSCSSNQSIQPILQDFQQRARVLIFAGHPSCLRRLMISAYTLNMTDGNYVYVTLEMEKGSLQYGTVDWQNGDEYDQIARRAYQSILLLAPFKEKSHFNTTLFANTLKTASLINYGYRYGETEEILNETISTATGYGVAWDPDDGAKFIQDFLGRLLTIPTGSIFIDKKGERIQELAVNQLNASTGKFQTTLRQEKSTYAFLSVVPLVWPTNWPPLDEPECGYLGTRISCQSNERVAIAAGSTSAVAVIIFVFLGLGVRFWAVQSRLQDRSWDIPTTALFELPAQSFASRPISASVSEEFILNLRQSRAGRYLGRQIWRKILPFKHPFEESRASVALILKIRALSHCNICSFIGILRTSEVVCLVSEFCLRGSLVELIANENVSTDRHFKRSIIQDILEGLAYIHASSLNFHGSLTRQNCLLDKHLTVKIAEAGFDRLFSIGFKTMRTPENAVWTAPELSNKTTKASAASDVYVLGHLLHWILTDGMDPDPANASPSLPVLAAVECHKVVKDLILRSWSTDHKLRPTIWHFKSQYIKVMGRSQKTVVDGLLDRMQAYSSDLEKAVDERTTQLLFERKKCDDILLERLPRDVVESLRRGQTVQPESFESATISFSNLSDFAEFSSRSSPTDVVQLLNKSHSLFDNVVSKFDVYKVETINDSYVVASGLPLRNGEKHAFEICRLALCTRKTVRSAFADIGMRLQVGMHTGACVAAVAGLKQPSYCLFGDTINTASRMESSGQSDKIQLSRTTADLVEFCSEFSLTSRGLISVKGKSRMEAFWLNSWNEDFN